MSSADDALTVIGTPVTVGQVLEALDGAWPFANAESWDQVGLLVGDSRTEVTGVAIALDPDLKSIAFAQSVGANVLLTHHPTYIQPPERFDVTHAAFSYAARVVHAAISAGLNLIACHTNLDRDDAARHIWGRTLELEDTGPLSPIAAGGIAGRAGRGDTGREPEHAAYGQTWFTPQPRSLETIAAELSAVTGTDLRVYGDTQTLIQKVATATGSATERIAEALVAGCELLIAGEFRYHDALAAVESGLCLIDMGHDVSERPLLELLHQEVIARTALPVESVHVIDPEPVWTGISTKQSATDL
ncbi:MAG: Nif3-like dinuclear metal center hexameric protein [Actinomycetes bacterium]|jgi:dinuclear metal center YbgI/SA1388 family protein|nr:Nif3-like dinuclear metal center hexameric protein [Actinomycetes bacterium]